MHSFKITLILVLLLILSSPNRAQQIDYKGFTERLWQKEGNTEYMFYTPSAAVPGEKCPMAVFLHGCCGEDDHATMRNAVDPPRADVALFRGKPPD